METLLSPVEIAPNLNAGVRVGGGWVTIGYSNKPSRESRVRYRWEIIFPDGSDCSDDDMYSGCQGGNLTKGLETLLSFLNAADEQGLESENLFHPKVVEFAEQYSDEIAMLAMEIQEMGAE